jgi:penicillin-binding protein 1C
MAKNKNPSSQSKRLPGWNRFLLIIVLAFVLGLLGLYGIARFSPFPELSDFMEHPISREILDRRGGLLYREHLEDGTRRQWTDLSRIPRSVRGAFLAGEDRRFYSHPGIDPLAILRAGYQNLTRSRTISGASTISMQLARIIAPHGGGIPGKITEMWNAVRLETRYSKDQILELYLNRIPFGRGNEGVTSASLAYFAIPVQALSPAQAAVLSVIPRSPTNYDPLRNPERLNHAAILVGERMHPPQTVSEISAAVEEARGIQPPGDPMVAPHFSLRVIREHPQDLHLHPSVRSRFRTSLDPQIQRTAEALISQAISDAEDNRVQNGAVLVIDNKTGEILAYVGSPDFFRDEISGQIDGVQIRRQPGSTLKPFLYGLALDLGYTAASILPDIPLALGGSEVYIPQNFNRSFSGPVRMRDALASSLNVPAVWMVSRLGVQNFVDQMIRLGFDLETQRHSVGTGIALGNIEVSLEELTRGYTSLVNHGEILTLHFTHSTHQEPMNTATQNNTTPGMTARSAGIIRDILGDAGSRSRGFGEYRLLRTSYPSFFKTGTANQFSNIWAIGGSPDITVGVWMGNVHGQSVQAVTGSSLPARIVEALLDHFSTRQSQFPEIPDVHQVWISSISGMAVDSHRSYAIQEYFPLGTYPDLDTWHQGANGQIRYPAEFIPWARDYQFSHYADSSGSGGSSWGRILYPNNQAQYYLDPYLEADGSQALRIEAVGEANWIFIHLNGMVIGSGELPLRLHKPLQPGQHTLELRDLEGTVLDRVVFRVGNQVPTNW